MQIDLPILESIKDYQAQHGLKYENYRRYRSYCSRRLHRLRRSLNVRQGIQSSAKARHQRAKKLIDISNTMVLEAAEKDLEYGERMLIIPLCLAERAWAYAMQLKQETGEHPRKRFHLVRRLKKASEHAQRFEKLCHDSESPCSERTKSESVAYAAYITGLYKLERENWKEAKENLYKALSIYYTLSVSIRKNDVLEHYRQRIDELRASLRYCAFNLGDQGTKESKVKLPNILQFHDLAFRHAQELHEEAERQAAAAAPVKMEVETAKVVETPKKSEAASKKKEESSKTVAAPPAKAEPSSKKPQAPPKKQEASPTKAEASSKKVSESKAMSARQAAPAVKEPEEDEEEDEDEFEEPQGDVAEESEEEEDSDEETDEDDKPQQTGGVSGLVKGWLGGAWGSRG